MKIINHAGIKIIIKKENKQKTPGKEAIATNIERKIETFRVCWLWNLDSSKQESLSRSVMLLILYRML